MATVQGIRTGVTRWFKSRTDELGIWFITTILLFGVASAVLHSDGGRLFEIWSFGSLQRLLSPFDPEGLPVVIVDAESLKPPLSGIVVTPRPELEALIRTIAAGRPKALAVDIDFSMLNGDWPAKGQDPKFFDTLLAIQAQYGVPIFLGVERTINGTSGGPLGLPRWDGMAVGTHGEDVGPERHTVAVPFWYMPQGYVKSLPNLPVAVALAYLGGNGVKAPHMAVAPFVEPIDISRPADTSQLLKGTWHGRALLNYSKLGQLVNQRVRVGRPFTYVPKDLVEDKIVIVGFANPSQTPDRFHPPWSADAAGVVFHAVAAYTLAAEPVYELKAGVRASLDFIFSFAAFMALTWKVSDVSQDEDDGLVPREQRIVLTTILAVVVIGIALVLWAHVLWLDFLVVALSLGVHPFFSSILERWRKRRHLKNSTEKDVT